IWGLRPDESGLDRRHPGLLQNRALAPLQGRQAMPPRFFSRKAIRLHRHHWTFEQLEDRTLLSLIPVAALDPAPVLAMPQDARSAAIAPGAPAYFQVHPATDAYLVAQVHADGTITRLSLLDGQGNVLVQSDGQSPGKPDDLIAQHVAAGTEYLEVQS